MDATPTITSYNEKIEYTWHDFVSKNNHNALAVFFLWAPVVLIYLLDISVWYAIFSAILGGIIGAKDRLGEIRNMDMFRTRFRTYPKAFVNLLQSEKSDVTKSESDELLIQKEEARKFTPFWNDIIDCLWKENYINNSEKELLKMPPEDKNLDFVQWPLFLLVGKVSLAMDLITEQKENPKQQWVKVFRDQYMFSAIKEVILSGCMMVQQIVVEEENKNNLSLAIRNLKDEIRELEVPSEKMMLRQKTNNIGYLVNAIRKLTKAMIEQNKQPIDYRQELDNVLKGVHPFVRPHEQYHYKRLTFFDPYRDAPKEGYYKTMLKRLYALLNEDYASTIPKNIEARRRLQFFTNSLFMDMPFAPTIRSMYSFSVLTPYYEEPVIYSKKELTVENEDGISILFYLQKIFPDEWNNFFHEISSIVEGPLMKKLQYEHKQEPTDITDLRLWASYRGQTLARTVRGIMYYREALIKQRHEEAPNDLHPEAFADLKFSYVVTCQKYGQQIAESKNEVGRDILHLMKMYPSLRVAYIHEVVKPNGEGKEYFSKLVKGNPNDLENWHQEIYSIKLPGNPILGEGKPENQNHALIFTRGYGLQTIDMNQDNYFEEALKMRNLLEEFSKDHGRHPPTILGVRENIFTGSVSSLAWFMSNQETSFVTLGQRVLARPLKVRMHYGHPDVFDRIFHITRGGISKASKSINVSEDIYAGYNSTLRGGNITHHEYIQVGKGRDVGLNQIALFEAKVSSGNGEQTLSRDVYRLGQFLDFFRMLSLYFTSVGYYVCTMMTILVVYIFLYGRAYLALSGIEKPLENAAKETKNKALQSTLDAEFLIQIGMFNAIPMLIVFILEQGVLKAIISFISMQLQLCSVFFTFSMGTRAHYFGKTILSGGAKYRPTGRGFVVSHIKFAENYRLYSRSHFLKAIEIAMLLLVYLAYGYKSSNVSYILLSFGSWMLVFSWLFAPTIFNPSGFEWQKTVEDFDDWVNWLFSRGSATTKDSESWEVWWEQQASSRISIIGQVLETIISLRFFIFQFGVVYHLNVVQRNTSLSVYGISWLVLLGIIIIFKVFSFRPKDASSERSLRFLRVILFIVVVIFLVVMILVTPLTLSDIFASLLAFIPTGWGILCIGIAWRDVMKKLQLWSALRGIARFYDVAIGALIFTPVVILSWFPFVSTFQTRLLFNQAFSRGLEISLILAGNRPTMAT